MACLKSSTPGPASPLHSQLDLTQDSMQMVFYGKYTLERAVRWLAWRESLVDPQHILNKSPLLTIMLMSKWFQEHPEESKNHPRTRAWTEQLLASCMAWAWPANTTSTELYFRLGTMLQCAGDNLDFVQTWAQDSARLDAVLEWCLYLEDKIRPMLNVSIRYALKEEGLVTSSPQDTILAAVFAHVATADCTDGQPPPLLRSKNVGILWQTRGILSAPGAALRFAAYAPHSLPQALVRGLLLRPNDSIDSEWLHEQPGRNAIFSMDPALSAPEELLDALVQIHRAWNRKNPAGTATWEAVCNTWPALSGIVQSTVAIFGEEALDAAHAMHACLVGYVADVQKKTTPPTLALDRMLDS